MSDFLFTVTHFLTVSKLLNLDHELFFCEHVFLMLILDYVKVRIISQAKCSVGIGPTIVRARQMTSRFYVKNTK